MEKNFSLSATFFTPDVAVLKHSIEGMAGILQFV